jgi:hypothetical protein
VAILVSTCTIKSHVPTTLGIIEPPSEVKEEGVSQNGIPTSVTTRVLSVQSVSGEQFQLHYIPP